MSCVPSYPGCAPCDPCPTPIPPLPQGRATTYTACELKSMPQFGSACPSEPLRYITVQQPSRQVVKKNIEYEGRTFNDANVVNRMEKYICPKVNRSSKIIRVPVIQYMTEIVKEPKVMWLQSYAMDPYVVGVPRVVIQPKEICQTLLCQPRPQIVDVPPPGEYCVYPAERKGSSIARPCPPYIIFGQNFSG